MCFQVEPGSGVSMWDKELLKRRKFVREVMFSLVVLNLCVVTPLWLDGLNSPFQGLPKNIKKTQRLT